jgi:hypothetical protein
MGIRINRLYMNELAKRIGLEYGVKMYTNRSDIYFDTVMNLQWGNEEIVYTYSNDFMMCIIYLRSPSDYWPVF